MKPTLLFLNENPLPKVFTKGTISGKELRLRSAIPQIGQIHVLAFPGIPIADPTNRRITVLESRVKVHLLPRCPYYLRAIPLFFFGLYYTRKLKPQLLEAESPIISGVAGVLLSRIFNLPLIVEVRASYHHLIQIKLKYIPVRLKQSILSHLLKYVYSHATLIIANSQTYARNLSRYTSKVIVVNPGLQNPPRYFTQKKPSLIIGFLGRLVPEKGVHLLLQAFDLVSQKSKIPVLLEIAGTGSSLTSLSKQAQSLPSHQSITFLGQVNNYQTLSRWSIFVNPNIVSHPLEMTNIEAALMYLPVVCFGHDHIPETVIHQQTGLKVHPRTIQNLTDAILYLIDHPRIKVQMGQKGHQFAQQKYQFDRQSQLLRQAYIKIGILK